MVFRVPAGGGPGSDTTAVHVDVASEIDGIALKAVPAGADVLVLEDSAAGFAKKKTTATALAGGIPLGRTVTVAKSGGDATTLAAGITAALALVPAPDAANPAAIMVYPGVYSEVNPLTQPAFVDIVGTGAPEVTIIEATVATSPIINGAAGVRITGLKARGADGVGGVGFRFATAGERTRLESCLVTDCETGVLATGAGVNLYLDAIVILRRAGETLDTAYMTAAGGRIFAFSCRANGEVGVLLGTGYLSTGAGSLLVSNGGQSDFNANGCQSELSGEINLTGHKFDGCTNSRRVGPGASGVLSSSSGIGQGETLDLLVDGATAMVELSGDQISPNSVSVLGDTTLSGLFIAPSTDDAPPSSTLVGLTAAGRVSDAGSLAAGQGIATAEELQAFQFDDSAGSGSKFTDVTTAARSISGSTFGFPAATQVTDAILVGAPRTHGGWLCLLDTAMSADGVLTWEFWNGAAWVEMPPGGTRGSGISVRGDFGGGMDYRANSAWEVLETQHVYFNNEIISTWAADDNVLDEVPNTGTALFWVRVRPSSLPTTFPVLDQIRVIYSSTVSSISGLILHGQSRVRKTQSISLNLFEPSGNNPAALDIAFSANGIAGFSFNSYNDAALDRAGILVPIDLAFDLSSPIDLTLHWNPSNANLGNIEVRFTYGVVADGDVVGTGALPGPLSEVTELVLVAAPGVQRESNQQTFKIRIPEANPDNGDQLFMTFERDARGSNPNDTYAGNFVMQGMDLDGVLWRIGKSILP